MSHFAKEQLAPYFERWDSVKETIRQRYNDKDKEAVDLMRDAINNYTQLLAYGGKDLNERNGKEKYILLPLNGEERFAFIKDKINSHYAYIQLDALYTETKKKASRLAIMKK